MFLHLGIAMLLTFSRVRFIIEYMSNIQYARDQMKCSTCGHDVLKHHRHCSECGEPNPYHLDPFSRTQADAEPFSSQDWKHPDSYPSERPSSRDWSPSSEPLGFWLGVVCVLFPIIGIILYFSWKNTKPRAAKSALWCGLIAFFIVFFLRITAR